MTLQTATPKSYRLARFFLRGRAWEWYLARLAKTEKRWNRLGADPKVKRAKEPTTCSGEHDSLRELGLCRICMDDASTRSRVQDEQAKQAFLHSTFTPEEWVKTFPTLAAKAPKATAGMSVLELHERAENFVDLMQVDPSEKNIRAAEAALEDLDAATRRMQELDAIRESIEAPLVDRSSAAAITPLVMRGEEPYCYSCRDYTVRNAIGEVMIRGNPSKCFECTCLECDHAIARSFEVPPAIVGKPSLDDVRCAICAAPGIHAHSLTGPGSYGPIWTEGVGVVIAG